MIRVFVVDEVPLIADILSAVIDDEPDIEVVGDSTDAAKAVDGLVPCDVILLSASLPDGGALRITEHITRRDDAPRVLVTGLADVEANVLRFIEAGASGYVMREDTTADLLDNIRAAHRGEAIVAPEMTMAVMRRMAELAARRKALVPDAAGMETLTPREREVLQHVARGATNREIGEALVIQVGTVKNHVHSILDKLNVHSRRDAAAVQALLEDGT